MYLKINVLPAVAIVTGLHAFWLAMTNDVIKLLSDILLLFYVTAFPISSRVYFSSLVCGIKYGLTENVKTAKMLFFKIQNGKKVSQADFNDSDANMQSECR